MINYIIIQNGALKSKKHFCQTWCLIVFLNIQFSKNWRKFTWKPFFLLSKTEDTIERSYFNQELSFFESSMQVFNFSTKNAEPCKIMGTWNLMDILFQKLSCCCTTMINFMFIAEKLVADKNYRSIVYTDPKRPGPIWLKNFADTFQSSGTFWPNERSNCICF